MKMRLTHLFITALLMTHAVAQFSSGSNGSYGPILVNSSTGDVWLNVPDDGIFHCTTIDVRDNRWLRFVANGNRTPVYLLATGDVNIRGIISVNGVVGDKDSGGLGGPGGFAGGNPASVSALPGDGHGPGAGKAGTPTTNEDGVGAGGYAHQSTTGSSLNHGGAYGNGLLVPLIGGSGGGGTTGNPGQGGGGGGGAILIASDTKIAFENSGDVILAEGNGNGGNGAGGGSGGAIRLVAPWITGNGGLRVHGSDGGAAGRIRVDTLNRSALNLYYQPDGVTSIGSLMVVFPSPLPRLDVISAAGNAIAEGSGPVSLILPFGSPSTQTITVQARDFNAVVPIAVVLTPDNGPSSIVEASIDNVTANPATVDVPVEIPANVQTSIHVWNR